MAERKAVNKYYPPDWDPRKGSVNKRVGQHPLRDRARKLGQGILVIRFELPYNIWCGGCGSHVGMGVRYNAEKSKVGNYYSTPIYKFRMKCHLCDNYFEIQTDPKNHDYVILSGARRKEQRWDPVANEQIVPEDKATQKKLATDAMYKLEHGTNDQQKGKEKVMNLAQIEDSRMSMKDDYILNRMARDKFRTEKKVLREAAEADRAIIEKASLDIDLVEESEEDRKLAGLLKYSVTSSYEDKQKEKRREIELRPLFGKKEKSSPASSSTSSSMLSSNTPCQSLIAKKGLSQKLDSVIRGSHKDPFNMTKSKGAGLLSSASTNPTRTNLGIKLTSYKTTAKQKAGAPEKCDGLALPDSKHTKPSQKTLRKDSASNESQTCASLSFSSSSESVEECEMSDTYFSRLADTNGNVPTISNEDGFSCDSTAPSQVFDVINNIISTPDQVHDTDCISPEEVHLSHSNKKLEDVEDNLSLQHPGDTRASVSPTSPCNIDSGLQTLISNYCDSDSNSSL